MPSDIRSGSILAQLSEASELDASEEDGHFSRWKRASVLTMMGVGEVGGFLAGILKWRNQTQQLLKDKGAHTEASRPSMIAMRMSSYFNS